MVSDVYITFGSSTGKSMGLHSKHCVQFMRMKLPRLPVLQGCVLPTVSTLWVLGLVSRLGKE